MAIPTWAPGEHRRPGQSSSGSLSSRKERKGREGKKKKAWGEGSVLAFLRCLWKMNHGGLQGGDPEKKHIWQGRKGKRIGLRKEQNIIQRRDS